MPKPQLTDGSAFTEVPPKIREMLGDEAHDFLNMILIRVFGPPGGVGDLDNDNVIGDLTNTTDHPSFTGVTAFQHHGAGEHDDLDQVAADANSDTTVAAADATAVTEADADATYGAEEQALINELKAIVDVLVTLANECKEDHNKLLTDHNDLKAKMRTAKLLAT